MLILVLVRQQPGTHGEGLPLLFKAPDCSWARVVGVLGHALGVGLEVHSVGEPLGIYGAQLEWAVTWHIKPSTSRPPSS